VGPDAVEYKVTIPPSSVARLELPTEGTRQVRTVGGGDHEIVLRR
jgi:hypothetical protein